MTPRSVRPGVSLSSTSSEIRAESGYGELQAVTTPARKRPVTRTYGELHNTPQRTTSHVVPLRHDNAQVRACGQPARRPLSAFCTNQAVGRRRGP